MRCVKSKSIFLYMSEQCKNYLQLTISTAGNMRSSGRTSVRIVFGIQALRHRGNRHWTTGFLEKETVILPAVVKRPYNLLL